MCEIALLIQQENEQHSTGRFDANRIGDPEVSVVDFIEGYDGGLSPATAAETAANPVQTKDRTPTKGQPSESIVDKDLVAWVSFGMIHLPVYVCTYILITEQSAHTDSTVLNTIV